MGTALDVTALNAASADVVTLHNLRPEQSTDTSHIEDYAHVSTSVTTWLPEK